MKHENHIEKNIGIIHVRKEKSIPAPNVMVRSNVYTYKTASQGKVDAFKDVAFRCRVVRNDALHEIIPPGLINQMNGQHDIPAFGENMRAEALQGTVIDYDFSLLPEQIKNLSAFRCSRCGRSTIHATFRNGYVEELFSDDCICYRVKPESGVTK